jgi:hypothetical protein
LQKLVVAALTSHSWLRLASAGFKNRQTLK